MARARRTNVVSILSDDQGAWAMGCAGNGEVRTPHLDRLAATGMRMESFFCASPVCSPARASLLTGRIPSQHGIHDWLKAGNVGDGAIEYLEGQTAYTDVLADNGYRCGISGKWHLGHSLKPQKGFTHWYVHQKGGSVYRDAPMVKDGRLITQPGYLTDAITDDAIDFLEGQARGAAPFYLSVHYTAPHSPWIGQHPRDIVDSYDRCPFDSCPQEPFHPEAVYRYGPEHVRECLKGYFAAVTAMDLGIGRLLDALERLGLREDTLVFFTSDNGFNCGHHGIWGKGNGTFSLNMYDTSVKVPAIASHPGRIRQGAVCDALVSGCDFMPTLLEYLGYECPGADRLPGRSFAPVLLGRAAAARSSVVVCDEYGPVRMIRTREWKYVHRHPFGPHELYHLADDPGERVNLVGDAGSAEMASRMKAALREWFLLYVDPRFDGIYEPVRGNGQIDRAGPEGRGRLAFDQDRRVITSPDSIPGVTDSSR